MVNYFFDSYAIIELVKGNPNYAIYSDEVVIITQFNLVEIYWSFLNDFKEEIANKLYARFRDCVVDLNDNILKEAVKFRKINKKKNFSYSDCIGYIYALKNNLIFLTGDKSFENVPNVQFVK